ncbi:DUF4129 domain-containing protein [Tumebacillus lipolyticus]|uniref:DUF4129 domain-containing protein n=1 Tax=Tumebacillus lipolyticus TaxID=1280370 RepID=A0ABW4ZU52_9BACL
MNRALRNVIWFSLSSQAFAMTTMFIILCGLLTEGTRYVPAFAGAAVALLLLAFFVYRRNNMAERRTFLIAGTVVLGLGVAGMVWIDSSRLLVPLLIYAGLSAFMIFRMSQTVDDMRYIRQSLLDQYKLDLQLIVFFIVWAILFQKDPAWQAQMVPFFVLFLFLRMTALSMASKMQRGMKGTASKMEKLQNNLPLIFVGVVVFAGWIFNSLGVPVFKWAIDALSKLLLPVFYAVGYVVEYLVNWLKGHKDAEGIEQAIDGMKESQPEPDRFEFVDDGSHIFNETTLFVIFAVLFLCLIWYFYRNMKRAQQLRAADGIVEMREFIHAEKPARAERQEVRALGPLTEMRKTYRRFLFAMKKAGFERGIGQTANEYVEQIAKVQPDRIESMEELTRYYMEERYGGRSVDDKLPRADDICTRLTEPDNKDGNRN